jgi:hypothetical protein
MRLAALALAAAVLGAPPAPWAADDPSLHLVDDPVAGRLLVPLAPGAVTPTEDAMTVKQGETGVFGPFVTEPGDTERRLGRGPVAFALYLATGASGMPDCAGIAVGLDKRAADGALTTLAGTSFPAALGPTAALTDPVSGLVPIAASASARTLGPGDVLELTVAVTNACIDGAHSVRLYYGSAARRSRIGFTDNCIAVDNPDQADADDDGAGDACDVCPGVADAAQADGDGDGVGDACDDCPAAPDPGQGDGDGDGVGSACDACPDAAGSAGAGGCPCAVAACDDEDPCSADSCDDSTGCGHERAGGLAFVECRLVFLRELIAGSEGVDAKVRRPSSPVRRALKQAGRALLRAEKAARRGARSYPRRAEDLGRRLRVFVDRILQAGRTGLVPKDLHDRLALLAGEALAAIPPS